MRVVGKDIILNDGSVLRGNPRNRMRIVIGTILRFRRGGAALMRIDKVEEDNHGFRLEGMNILGDAHSAYAHDCLHVTDEDLALWSSYSSSRKESFLVTREA